MAVVVVVIGSVVLYGVNRECDSPVDSPLDDYLSCHGCVLWNIAGTWPVPLFVLAAAD